MSNPHAPVRQQWLAQLREEVIDPEIPIVDSHHHLWDRPGSRYLIDDLVGDITSGHNVVATVFAQCRAMLRADGPREMAPLGEVEFANGQAAISASGKFGSVRASAAIIAGADLSLGERVIPVLESMQAAAGLRLRGVRNPVAWHESPRVQSSTASSPPRGLMADKDFRRGVASLKEFDLSLDIWAYHTQLDEIWDLASNVPDVPMVIDHFGGPVGVGPHAGKRDATFTQWRSSMSRLAALPNTFVKLGGAGMPVFGFAFHERPIPPDSMQLADAMRPYFTECVDLFGVERCMFESNFPVDKGMFSYQVLWNAFKRLATGASISEKMALFNGTAKKVYRIS